MAWSVLRKAIRRIAASAEVKMTTKTIFSYLYSRPCSTRNAIRLLEIKGYPKKIVDEANKTAMKLSAEMKDINR